MCVPAFPVLLETLADHPCLDDPENIHTINKTIFDDKLYYIQVCIIVTILLNEFDYILGNNTGCFSFWQFKDVLFKNPCITLIVKHCTYEDLEKFNPQLDPVPSTGRRVV